MRLIDADMVLKDIKDLQKSPWHNRWSESDSLCLQNQYVGRKEAVEIVRDLCVVKAKEVQAIPLDKVKQAKLEVEDIRELTKDGWKSPRELKEEFIEILNKLTAESEG